LLALLPRATTTGTQGFHWGSVAAIAAAIGFAAFALTRPSGKRERWFLAALVTAVLSLMGDTASGFAVDRLTKHPASTDCVSFYVQLDELVDDEPISVAQQALNGDPRTRLCRAPLIALHKR
jgi:hypothetical protein